MARNKKQIIFKDLEVVDAGAKGKSIAKTPEGKVVFIPNAVPGDVVDVLVTKKRRAYYEGKAQEFHEFSDKRVEPKCTHFSVCGGCKWQYMGYDYQLFYKQKEVTQNLKNIGKIEHLNMLPIVSSKEIYYYRNKMEFSFSNKRWLSFEELKSGEIIEDKNALGFHISGMWDKILDIKNCHLQEKTSNDIRLEVKHFSEANNLSFYDVREQKGLLRNLMIRTSSTSQIMVVVQFGEEDIFNQDLLLNHLEEKFHQITSLMYVINTKKNDTIYDQDVICYKGQPYIIEEMEDLKFKVGPKSFYQTNSKQAYKLYSVVKDFASFNGNELVYDLYTGIGTIAQFISRTVNRVVALESVPEAIEDARENTKINNIDNIDFFVGDMKKILTPQFVKKNGIPDVVIVDPPRDGMHKDVVSQLLNISPKKIVYVSCNSATQARDIELMKGGYYVVKSQAVDMFPQTHHVENVVLLERN